MQTILPTRPLSRRHAIALLAAGFAMSAAPVRAQATAEPLGLDPTSSADRTAAMQAAMDAAARSGRPLVLPGGDYRVAGLSIPGGLTVIGNGTATLTSAGPGSIARISATGRCTLDGIVFAGESIGGGDNDGLLVIENSAHVLVRNCRFIDSRSHGLVLRSCTVSGVQDCSFATHRSAAIVTLDSKGSLISGNDISQCGDNGIQIWGSSLGHQDGSIVTGNRISEIDWRSGGNGQNGNEINVFRADGVIVADNQISECAFSAVRLNATNNTQVRGNTCLKSGEVAIFSEFGFSASLIADNIVDGAAGGISVTNFNEGGRLAVVSGNLVRNILPRSEVNPDTTPFGIAAEADTAVTGNVVDEVPGVGISAGWGPYLRDVLVANNLVRSTQIGIAVSVADGAGAVQVNGNMLSGARRAAIVGAVWTEVVSDDLVGDAGRFPHTSLSDNRIT